MKRNVLNSPRLLELKKRRRKAFLNKILISGFGLLVIFILLAYLSRLNSLNIAEVQIVGNKIVDTEAIRTIVDEQITGKYLWLFPKTNILFYPENNIKNELQNKFKRLKEVSLSIESNKVLLVSLVEQEAKYIWCGANLPVEIDSPNMNNNNQKYYFLNEDGYIFDEAPYFSGEVYFKFYGLTDVGHLDSERSTSVDIPLGSYFSKQNFKQLISFRDILVSIGLKPIALYATPDGDIQILLSDKTPAGSGPKIIFRADSNFQNVAENLEAALNTEPLQSKFKNNYSSLQYIDLRFGNKVYDKFQ